MMIRRRVGFLAGLLLACGSAYGASLVAEFTPATVAQGLFFGLAHPVSELDHLGMLVGAATIAVMAGGTLRLPLVFVAATLAGVRLHGFGIDLLLVELAMMALSVFGCGLVLLLGRARPRATLAACFAAAGIAHGCAYAQHIATTTAATFLAALLGLVVVQVAAVTAVYYAGRGVAARGAGAASGLFEATGNYVVMAGTIALLLAAV